jgi:hypothetical protein
VDPADRLAAYLADELRADERAELEAALARDPGLRRMLAAMRRADGAVARLDPPTPAPGFDDRFDAAVDAVLAETLDPSGTANDAHGAWSHRQAADDELAARRRRVPTAALGAAAAGLVLLVGGVVITQLVGDDRSATEQALDTDADVADEEAADVEGVDGPTVVADDREVDADDLDALLAADELTGLADQRLDELTGGDLARAYQVQLGQQPELQAFDDAQDDAQDTAPEDAPTADAPDAAGDQDGDDSGDAEVAPEAEMEADQPEDGVDDEDARRQRGTVLDPEDLPEVRTREGEPLDDDATQDLARCLGEVLAGGPGAIPVYAELATFDGEDAVVLGLLTTEPASGAFTRREVWALSRDDCQVLRFSQDDAPR